MQLNAIPSVNFALLGISFARGKHDDWRDQLFRARRKFPNADRDLYKLALQKFREAEAFDPRSKRADEKDDPEATAYWHRAWVAINLYLRSCQS